MTPAAQHAMKSWEPRRALSLSQARTRTNLVKILRAAFTVGAAASAGVLLGYVVSHSINQATFNAPQPAAGVTMLNPRFTGRDGAGVPYAIVADTARRRLGVTEIIDLRRPVMEDANGGVVRSRDGVFDRSTQTLELVGDVQLADAGGYLFVSERATMFVEDNRVEGATPLIGTGPIGELRADTYEVLDGGDRVILRGNVWTRIVSEDEFGDLSEERGPPPPEKAQ
ncbi:MAG: hypothetical protein AAF719_11425 [Pseudomonadota bacterium]